MMDFKLRRIREDEDGTFGILLYETIPFCRTLERKWDDNKEGTSRIPPGQYKGVRFHSPHFGYDLFKLVNVPGRSDVEIHRGNTVADSHGCILLGTNFTDNGIDESKKAFDKFMSACEGFNEINLEIKDV